MKMKAEDKAKWLEALRSGEYKQTAETLCHDGAYCCLGVLETVLDGDVEKDAQGRPLSAPTCDFLVRHNIEVEVRQKYNYEGDEVGVAFPAYAFNGVYARLMELNDDRLEQWDPIEDEYMPSDEHVNTFKDIADFIEKNVEVYD